MKWIAILAGAAALAVVVPAAAQQAAPRPAANPVVPLGLISFQIGVTDFQKSIDFYSALGMKLGRKPHDNEWELVWDKPSQGASIMMLRADPAKPSKVVPGGSFLIVGVADAQAVVARLHAAGRTDVAAPRDAGTYQVALIKDPDGNTIEMIGPKK